MCLYSTLPKLHRPGQQQTAVPAGCHLRQLGSSNCRRPLPCPAALLQQRDSTASAVSSVAGGAAGQVLISKQSAGTVSTGTDRLARDVAPSLPASTVEVHFEVQYGCQFGQHVSIVGTFQGWQVPAAVAMTWSQGDVWNAVLPVPVGTDIEYKYIVMWDDGSVSRWQEGPNNRLSVQHPGVLMHVQDTWSQRDRSVREVGPRLTHNQDQKQSGGHSSGKGAAMAKAAAAAMAAPVPAGDGAPAAAQPSGSSQVSGNTLSSLQQQLQFAAGPPTQAAWGAMQQQQPVAVPVAVPLDVVSLFEAAQEDELHLYEDEEEDQHWPADMLQKARAAAAAAGSTGAGTAAAPPAATASSRSGQGQQQQQQGAADVVQLLPELQTELQAALAALAQHPEAAHEHGSLLTEGQSVLAALQQQLPAAPQDTAHAPGGSTAADAAGKSSSRGSSSSSSSSAGRGSPGRSPNSSLTSGDEIAAALLSDDCEEACFCMVDAICSCDCDPDTPCELSSDDEDQEEALGSHAHQRTTPSSHAQPQPAATHTGTSSSHGALSGAELARGPGVFSLSQDPAVLAARAAAFTDVQDALDKSTELRQALFDDPCNPLMLEADRNLATVSRQLHSGHLLA